MPGNARPFDPLLDPAVPRGLFETHAGRYAKSLKTVPRVAGTKNAILFEVWGALLKIVNVLVTSTGRTDCEKIAA